MKINRKSIALAGALMFALAAITIVYTTQAPVSPPANPRAVLESESVSLTIQELYTNKPIEITVDETVFQVLQILNTKDPRLELQAKDYPGVGTLVTSIHGLTNGRDKKYWQYKVNGVMPQIGADQYKLKNGDSIEWFFGSSQE